jgi:hypothetical protein
MLATSEQWQPRLLGIKLGASVGSTDAANVTGTVRLPGAGPWEGRVHYRPRSTNCGQLAASTNVMIVSRTCGRRAVHRSAMNLMDAGRSSPLTEFNAIPSTPVRQRQDSLTPAGEVGTDSL